MVRFHPAPPTKGTGMIKVIAFIIPLLLMSCADIKLSDSEDRKDLRIVLETLVRSYNAQGIDPIQMDDQKLAWFSITCASVSTLYSLRGTTDQTQEVLDWCGTVREALGTSPNKGNDTDG